MSDNFDDIIRQVLSARGSPKMQRGDAPGMLIPGNIDLHARPRVKNEDGSVSTVRSMSFTDDDGRNVLIPTVAEGRGIMPEDQAKEYYRMTGQHLGIFDTPENATAYAIALHNQQADEYK
jgi:hypothetical protein